MPRLFDADEERLARHQLCGGELDRPVVVAGNGPSTALLEPERVPDDPIVLRTNMFFLERDRILGDRVDGLFWASDQPALARRLFEVVQEGRYDIRAFFSPLLLHDSRSHGGNAIFDAFFKPQFDHWAILAAEPVLAEAMARRPMPTQGMQMLATVARLGFRNVHLAGVDFYQDLGVRYAYPIPDELVQEQKAEHFAPGYEAAHSLECDVAFLEKVVELYPDLSLRLLTPSPLLEERFDRSELVA